jgi:hypothetical protein
MLDKSGWLLEMPQFEGKKTLGRRLSIRKTKPKKFWSVLLGARRRMSAVMMTFLVITFVYLSLDAFRPSSLSRKTPDVQVCVGRQAPHMVY